MHDAVIIGGGLAGLTAAIVLARAGKKVVLLEKGTFPSHKVCGEYVSNETLPFLRSIGADPSQLNPVQITQFQLSSPSGNSLQMPLDLGGFGISRYSFDSYLAAVAIEAGAEILSQKKVYKAEFNVDAFAVHAQDEEYSARVAIGAFGKRSNLDRELNRPFLQNRSPYMGVKYHIKADFFPENLVALHNFRGGYCGISSIEDDKQCLCYLVHRNALKEFGSIETMENKLQATNPHLKKIFTKAEFLYASPEVINEISFENKEPVLHHMLMAGDAAGMVVPLFGNGMAMAIHAGKLAAEAALGYLHGNYHRGKMEELYTEAWKKKFTNRLWLGRQLQQTFGRPRVSKAVVRAAKLLPPLAKLLVRHSHGKPF